MRIPAKTRGVVMRQPTLAGPGSRAPWLRSFMTGILGGIITVGLFLLITAIADGTPTFTVTRCLILTVWVVGLGVVGIATERRYAREAGRR